MSPHSLYPTQPLQCTDYVLLSLYLAHCVAAQPRLCCISTPSSLMPHTSSNVPMNLAPITLHTANEMRSEPAVHAQVRRQQDRSTVMRPYCVQGAGRNFSAPVTRVKGSPLQPSRGSDWLRVLPGISVSPSKRRITWIAWRLDFPNFRSIFAFAK